MNIKQIFTFGVIAVAVYGLVYAERPESLLTRSVDPSDGPARKVGADDRSFPVSRFELAQAEGEPATELPPPREILTAAVEKLKTYSSIRANVMQKVNIQSHTFVARGSYLQGQNLQLRMEFSMELGGAKRSLLEVCDGQVLWSRHDLGEKDQTQITRRDVREILKAAEQAEQRMKTPDEKQMLQAGILADLGTGGLPALMSAFVKDYDFKSARIDRVEDRDVIVLEGAWTPKYREMWLGAKARDRNPPPLPPYIPDSVRISLDRETEFPRKIEYLKTEPGQKNPSTMVSLEYSKVVFNGKVNRDDFVFIPPERPTHIDVTQLYLQRLAPPKAATKSAAPAEKAKPAESR